MNSKPELIIHTYTGERRHAGTNSRVYIKLYGDDGSVSSKIYLNNLDHNDFEWNQMDTFVVKPEDVETMDRSVNIERIEFWKSKTYLFFDDWWYVDKIVVENRASNINFPFPVFRWIKPGYHYNFQIYDTSLPQDAQFVDQRTREMADRKKAYQLYSKIPPHWPAQVKSLPKDEDFSTKDTWDMVKLKIGLTVASTITKFTNDEFQSLEDIDEIYDGETFKKPPVAEKWDSDYEFGRQRMNGVNPRLLSLYTTVTRKFPVTDELLGSLLEGLTIRQAIQQKRLFCCDLKILDGIHQTPGVVLCHPLLLMFKDNADMLRPVAIQLFQEPAHDNPIFTANDDKLLWTIVKMWYNNAECCHHQALTHLGFTHLLMEGVAISANRQMSNSHPVLKILQPHFLYLIAINTLALTNLVSPGGWVDKTMAYGAQGMLDLTMKGFSEWRMDVDGIFPESLNVRGVLDKDLLPQYHYRDDGLMLYDAIKKYVTSYVSLYYTNDDKLAEDHELQGWASELVQERKKYDGGVGLKGVPGNGRITSTSQLVDIVTCVIFTCSVAHASANFAQYEQYAYPPNYPTYMKGTPPTCKDAKVTEQDIIKSLVGKDQAVDILVVTTLLSRKATNSLGDFEVQYIHDPMAVQIVQQFREDLSEISDHINTRNEQVRTPYDDMLPAMVPNAISI